MPSDRWRLPDPPQWVPWALGVLIVASVALFGCLAVATQVSDTALRDALGMTFAIGTYFVVWPAIFAVCLIGIVVHRGIRTAKRTTKIT